VHGRVKLGRLPGIEVDDDRLNRRLSVLGFVSRRRFVKLKELCVHFKEDLDRLRFARGLKGNDARFQFILVYTLLASDKREDSLVSSAI
jgi:hypothetical protein